MLPVVAATWTVEDSERCANVNAMVPEIEERFRDQRQDETTRVEQAMAASSLASFSLRT